MEQRHNDDVGGMLNHYEKQIPELAEYINIFIKKMEQFEDVSNEWPRVLGLIKQIGRFSSQVNKVSKVFQRKLLQLMGNDEIYKFDKGIFRKTSYIIQTDIVIDDNHYQSIIRQYPGIDMAKLRDDIKKGKEIKGVSLKYKDPCLYFFSTEQWENKQKRLRQYHVKKKHYKNKNV